MELKMILYNSGKEKSFFELESGIRPWDIIFTVSKGSFSLTFTHDESPLVFHPYEIAYIPANTSFVRQVIEPVDFHQFAFQRIGDDIMYNSLSKGKLQNPKEHVKALMESADMLSLFPERHELPLHILSHILTENYIFSRGTDRFVSGMSCEISQVVEYINDHLQDKIDIDALADRVYLSHTGLIWRFKKELNMTPSEYLIAVRMRRAKQLLLEKDISIGQIAEKCGYANTYYFSNAFRRYVGMRPSDFRILYLD